MHEYGIQINLWICERLIICTCDSIKGVDDHDFICAIGIDGLRYRLL